MSGKKNNLFAGYVRLFFKHIIRSALVSVPVYVAAGLLSIIVAFVVDLILEIFGVKHVLWTPTGLLILGCIFGFFGGLGIVFGICGAGDDGKRRFEDDGYYTFKVGWARGKYRYPRYAGVAFELFLHLALWVGVIVWAYLKYYKGFAAAYDDSFLNLLALLAFPILLTSQIAYFLWGLLEYGSARCDKCRHVFCLDENSRTTDAYNTYDYTETTKRENIGSIGDVQIYANVTRGKVTKTRHTKADVNINCCACGDHRNLERHSTYTK